MTRERVLIRARNGALNLLRRACGAVVAVSLVTITACFAVAAFADAIHREDRRQEESSHGQRSDP